MLLGHLLPANRKQRGGISVCRVGLNGRLSKEDLVVAYSVLLGEHSGRGQVDTDNHGYIDYTEFSRVTTDTSKLLSERNLRSAFSLFDRDGKISANEIKDVLSGGMYSNDGSN